MGFHFPGDGDRTNSCAEACEYGHRSMIAWTWLFSPVRPYYFLEMHRAVPLKQSLLSSVSTALGYSAFHTLVNGFSNAGTHFLFKLDLAFLFVLRDGDEDLWFSADVLWKDSAYRVEIFPPEFLWKGQMWDSMNVFIFETLLLWTTAHTTHVFLYEQFRPLQPLFLLKSEAYAWDYAKMWSWHIFLKGFETIKSSQQQYRRCMRQDSQQSNPVSVLCFS